MQVIPRSVLQKAQGFAFLTVMKASALLPGVATVRSALTTFQAGFLLSARAGSGVVVARLADDSTSCRVIGELTKATG